MSILAFLITAVLVPMLVNEFTDWLPWFAARLIGVAARTMPPAVRSRYAEEWLAELDVVPGNMSKLALAIRILASAPSTAKAINRVPSGGTGSVSTLDLGVTLATLARDRSALYGLRVNLLFDRLPTNLPAPVTEALAAATSEALNNVAHHAGVNEVWLTASGDGCGGVSVTLVDRGRGFDPGATRTGLGLARSIGQRIRMVGGYSNIDSGPGQGTRVGISWAP